MSVLTDNTAKLRQILEIVQNLPESPADPVLQDKTVTPTLDKQTVKADSGYDGLGTVTVNAMPTATQATPSIEVSNSGLITASANQSAGYVSAGTKSATRQLPTKSGTTITPGDAEQTAVSAGTFVTGDIKVAAAPSGGGSGGLPGAISKIAAGTYTPSSDITSSFDIYHDLGVIPDAVVFTKPICDDETNYMVFQFTLSRQFTDSYGTFDAYGIIRYCMGTNKYGISTRNLLDSDITSKRFGVYASSSYKLKAGLTYSWVAVKFV